MALLPWVLVPLVGASARARPRAAAMRSGLAVLCMGAVNATAVLALLPLPALWLLPGLRTAARAPARRLVRRSPSPWPAPGGWSRCCCRAATAPTSSTRSRPPRSRPRPDLAGEVLRGTLALARLRRHRRRALVAGGLDARHQRRRRARHRGPRRAVRCSGCCGGACPRRAGWPRRAALGLLAMSAGHAGPLDGPLDGAAARGARRPAGAVPQRPQVRRAASACPSRSGCATCSALAPAAGRPPACSRAVAALGLVGTGHPRARRPAGARGRLRRAADWWTCRPASGSTSTAPAAGPWSCPPPASASTSGGARSTTRSRRSHRAVGRPRRRAARLRRALTRLLDAVQARLDTGRGSPALAEVLARSGVRYLVVEQRPRPLPHRRAAPGPRAPGPRRLARPHAAPPPSARRSAVSSQSRDPETARAFLADEGLDAGPPRRRGVRGRRRRRTRWTALPRPRPGGSAAGRRRCSSWPSAGCSTGRGAVLAGDGDAGPSPRSAVTDALRRREVNSGSVRDNASATLTAVGAADPGAAGGRRAPGARRSATWRPRGWSARPR